MAGTNGDSSRKRLRTQDCDNSFVECGDEENDENNVQLGPFLACPFYKFDPHTHYRCLEKYKLRRIPDVRQHLSRCHGLKSNYHCTICSRSWKYPGPWEKHVQNGACQRVVRPEKRYPDQLRILEEIPKGSDADKWFFIWDKLFGGCDRPQSPYIQDGIAEPISVIRPKAETALQSGLYSLFESFNISFDMTLGPSFVAQVGRIMFETTSMTQAQQMPRRTINHSGHQLSVSDSTLRTSAVATVGQASINTRNPSAPINSYQSLPTQQMADSRTMYQHQRFPAAMASQSLAENISLSSSYIYAEHPAVTPDAESFFPSQFSIAARESHNIPPAPPVYGTIPPLMVLPIIESEPYINLTVEDAAEYDNIMVHDKDQIESATPGESYGHSTTPRSGYYH